MNWNDLKTVVSGAAPLLGGLLVGPAGELAGVMIGKALGVEPTPDAIFAELKNNPEALIKLKEIEATKEVELEKLYVTAEANRLAADTQRIQAVNFTMQAESKNEHWVQFSWRPFWGFVSGIAFLAVATLICYLAYLAIALRDHEAMRMIPDLIVSMAELFIVPGAILGVSAWHRGKQKRVQAGDKSAGLMDAISSRLKRKVE